MFHAASATLLGLQSYFPLPGTWGLAFFIYLNTCSQEKQGGVGCGERARDGDRLTEGDTQKETGKGTGSQIRYLERKRPADTRKRSRKWG